jgi:hypothetical protein
MRKPISTKNRKVVNYEAVERMKNLQEESVTKNVQFFPLIRTPSNRNVQYTSYHR